MSIAENYLRAAKSSHLEWRPTLGDIDRVTAAGLVPESLATRLMRLRADFDALSSTTESRVMLRLLRGFHPANEALLSFALEYGKKPPERVEEIVAKVLDIFLDSNCPMCDGRGFTGNYGTPQIRCAACRESGKRTAYYRNDAEEGFARWLHGQIDIKIAAAIDAMRRALRQ